LFNNQFESDDQNNLNFLKNEGLNGIVRRKEINQT